MRHSSTALVVTSLLFLLTARPSATQQTSTAAIQRDQQALTVLAQVLKNAGGATALATIQDFTGSGSITYNWPEGPAQGSVKVKGRGISQFRLDATLADGVHSWVVANGTALQKQADGSITPLPYPLTLKPASITFPFAQLVVALQDTSWSISYGGLVLHNGQQVYDIGFQKILPQGSDPFGFQSSVTKANFFIDPDTFSILSLQDRAYRKDHEPGDVPHEIQFSNYQILNGVRVPLSVTELVSGQQTVTIQLSQITFNSGLTDADFAL